MAVPGSAIAPDSPADPDTGAATPRTRRPDLGGTSGLAGNLSSMLSGGSERAMATLRRADEASAGLDQQANKLQSDLEGLKTKAEHPPDTFHSNPVAAFGSAAMFLATMGSLMTRRPFVTALNAGADVVEAYKKNDLAAAQQAFGTWKAQLDTAMTIHRFEQEAYRLGVDKVQRDREGAKTDLAVTAAAMKDQVVLHLLENGRMDDAVNVIAGRRIMGQRAGAAGTNAQVANTKMQLYQRYQAAVKAGKTEEAENIKQELNDFVSFVDPVAARAGVTAGIKDPFRQDKLDAWEELKAARQAGDEAGIKTAQQKLDDIRTAEGKKTSSVKPATAGQEVTNATRVKIDDMIKRENEARAAAGKPPLSDVEKAEITSREMGKVVARSEALTPAIVRDYQRVIDKADTGLEHADQALDIMNNHIAVAGGLGKLGRAAETLGNILGAEGTARAEFRNHITMLKEAMADSQNTTGSRPLAAQMKLIDDLLETNRWGVSSRAVFTAIQQVSDELYRRHQISDAHLKGTWNPDAQYQSLRPLEFGGSGPSRGNPSPSSSFSDFPAVR